MDEPIDYEALPASSTLCDHMLAGACAGIMEHCVMYPVDCVKTRMQCLRSLHHTNYSNVFHGLFRLIQTEGIRGSLRGIGAMVGGAGPAHAAYFACYEHMKELVESIPVMSAHLAPAFGGACATLLHDAVMTPAEAVKQRLQMYNSPYHNSVDCFRRVCLTEGPRALYRAYFTQLTMNIPYQSIHFLCYEAAQEVLNPGRHYLPWTHMIAGGTAGCVAAAVTTPLDVCKTVLNTQERCTLPHPSSTHSSSSHAFRIHGLLGAVREVYALGGARAFLSGMSARVLTAVPGTAISWSVYEYFKWYLRRSSFTGGSGSEGTVPGDINYSHDASSVDRSGVGRRGLLITAPGEVACASSRQKDLPIAKE